MSSLSSQLPHNSGGVQLDATLSLLIIQTSPLIIQTSPFTLHHSACLCDKELTMPFKVGV